MAFQRITMKRWCAKGRQECFFVFLIKSGLSRCIGSILFKGFYASFNLALPMVAEAIYAQKDRSGNGILKRSKKKRSLIDPGGHWLLSP